MFVVGGMLVAGLWPFHSPKNDVSWLRDGDGVRFGGFNTILSAGTIKVRGPGDEASCSLEISLTPASVYHDTQTFLGFYTPQNPLQLLLRQSHETLLLKSDVQDEQRRIKSTTIGVNNVFRKGKVVFMTVTIGSRETLVYIDGALVSASPPLTGEVCTGRLVLGDSPVRSNPWTGQLQRLAIYSAELPAPKVRKNYESGATEADEHRVALYLFDERENGVVHNKVRPGRDLYIPERYEVMQQFFLERPESEYRSSLSYWKNVALNVGGFIPMGLLCCMYWSSAHPIKQAAFATILLGAAISFAIEVLQGWLPTRSSGTTDLLTNTLGTFLGVMLFAIRRGVSKGYGSGITA